MEQQKTCGMDGRSKQVLHCKGPMKDLKMGGFLRWQLGCRNNWSDEFLFPYATSISLLTLFRSEKTSKKIKLKRNKPPKKKALLSIESWLFSRNPCFMGFRSNPHTTGVVVFHPRKIRHLKRPRFFGCC